MFILRLIKQVSPVTEYRSTKRWSLFCGQVTQDEPGSDVNSPKVAIIKKITTTDLEKKKKKFYIHQV